MIKKIKANEGIQYKKLSPEEMKARGILGQLIGPCADFNNATRNGRKYSEQLWENVFNNPLMQEKIKNGVCFGELGHPEDRTEIDMEKIAVCLREQPVKNDKGQLCAVFDILDTPNGRILKTLCDYGSTVGVSSRGQGDLITDMNGDEAVDPDTYECECWDIVLTPAVESARMQYVKESLDANKLKLKKALTESLNKASEEDKKVMRKTLEELNIKLSEDLDISEDEYLKNADEFIKEIESTMSPEDASRYYYKEFEFDKKGPEDEAEERIYVALRKKANITEAVVEKEDEDVVVKVPEENIEFDDSQLVLSDQDVEEINEPFEDEPNGNENVEAEVSEDEVEDTRTDEEVFFDYLKANFDEKQIKKACKALEIELPEDEDSEENEKDEKSEEKSDDETEIEVDEVTEVEDDVKNESLNESDKPAAQSVEDCQKWVDYDMEHYGEISANTKEIIKKAGFQIIRDQYGDYEVAAGDYKESANKECNNESCTDKLEESSKQTVNETTKAIDNGDAELIKSLQEALKVKLDLEGSVKSLQEKLAVSDTKVNELIEENNKYKKSIVRLANMSKSNKTLKENVSNLEESLKEKDALIDEQKSRIARLVKSRKESVSESASLSESIETKKSEITTLNENLNKSKDEVKALNEKLNNSDSKISELNESLTKATTLKEAYKNLANKAVNKYIDIKAKTLGLTSKDIKRKLGESYTLEDVDQVCEDLKSYQLNVSKLPFSIDRKVGIRVNESTNTIKSKSSRVVDDDEVDDSLIKLARI